MLKQIFFLNIITYNAFTNPVVKGVVSQQAEEYFRFYEAERSRSKATETKSHHL